MKKITLILILVLPFLVSSQITYQKGFSFAGGLETKTTMFTPTADSGILVGGKVVYATAQKPFLAKLDAQGDTVWAKEYGISAMADFRYGLSLGSGNTLIIGQKDSTDVYLLKIASDGSVIFSKKFNLGTITEIRTAKLLSQNQVALVGTKISAVNGQKSAFTSIIDTAGTITKTHLIEKNLFEVHGIDAVGLPNGHYIILSSYVTNIVGLGQNQLLFSEYDDSHNLVNNNNVSITNYNLIPKAMEKSLDGDIYLVGFTENATGNPLSFLLRYSFDNGGEVKWSKIFLGIVLDQIVRSSDNRIVVAGTTDGNFSDDKIGLIRVSPDGHINSISGYGASGVNVNTTEYPRTLRYIHDGSFAFVGNREVSLGITQAFIGKTNFNLKEVCNNFNFSLNLTIIDTTFSVTQGSTTLANNTSQTISTSTTTNPSITPLSFTNYTTNCSACKDPVAVIKSKLNGLTVGFKAEDAFNCLSYSWDFGDGNTSSNKIESHTYGATGIYDVCLTVTNLCGTKTYCRKVVVVDPNNGVDWNRSTGTSNGDTPMGVKNTSDGGFVVVGKTNGFGSSKTNTSGDNLYVMKTDENGNVEWINNYGGTGNEAAVDIETTNDGGYMMVGYTETSGAGGKDIFVQKIDSAGTTEWFNTYGGANDETAASIEAETDSTFIIGGTSNSFSSGDDDAIVFKIDFFGNIIWQKSIGGTADDNLSDGKIDGSGNFVWAGTTSSYGSGGDDGMVMKIDGSGNFVWANAYGSTGDESFNDGKIDGSGNFVWAGSTTSIGTGDSDGMVMKIDGSGNFVWANAYGTTNDENGNDLKIDGNDVYVTGSNNTSGSNDAMVYKIDGSGNFVWANAYGSTGDDETGTASYKISNNSLLIWGSTTPSGGNEDIYNVKVDSLGNSGCDQAQLNFTTTSMTGSNLTSITPNITDINLQVAKSDSTPSILVSDTTSSNQDSVICVKTTSILPEISADNIQISAYPNPSTGTINLDFSGMEIEKNSTIEVYNIMGKRVYSEEINNFNNQTFTFKLNQANGVYQIKVSSGNKNYHTKIILVN